MDKREKLAQLLLDLAREYDDERAERTRRPPIPLEALHPKSAEHFRSNATRILSLLAEGPGAERPEKESPRSASGAEQGAEGVRGEADPVPPPESVKCPLCGYSYAKGYFKCPTCFNTGTPKSELFEVTPPTRREGSMSGDAPKKPKGKPEQGRK